MKRYLFAILFLSLLTEINAQPFEGKIFFIKQSITDTIHFVYLVKDNMMRVDEMNDSKNVLQSLLIDLENKKMTAISPSRKMYMPFPVSTVKKENSTNFTIEQTKKSKKLFNYSCNFWTIKNINVKSNQ